VLDAVPECATGGVAFRLVVTATRVKALPAAEQASLTDLNPGYR
jgi:hypothetical protein